MGPHPLPSAGYWANFHGTIKTDFVNKGFLGYFLYEYCPDRMWYNKNNKYATLAVTMRLGKTNRS